MNNNRNTSVVKECKESIIALYEKPLSRDGLSSRITNRIEKYERKRALVGIVSNAFISISSIAVAFTVGASIVSTLQSSGFFEYTNTTFVSDIVSSGAFTDSFALVIENMPGVAIALFVVSLALSVWSIVGLVRFTQACVRLSA
jgi:hypothetical protein